MCEARTLVAGVDLSAVLGRTISLVQGLGEDFAGDDGRLEELKARLAQGRFHLAVLGQFKRGKSTLLNALLGEAILPTAIVPLTAIPTFIRPGSQRRAHVVFQDDRNPEEFATPGVEELTAFLSRFVTESGNPKNHLGVSHVEVTHPAAILSHGVVLIDTPGIGSTFRHNTEATLNFLPQCDAAMFVISADPPITEVEVDFLKQVRGRVARLFFIMNKADYLSGDERQAAVDFLRKMLAEQAAIAVDVPVLCVSARQGLQSRQTSDPELWRTSGLAEVERYLLEFLAQEKTQTLHEAIRRKVADIVADVLMRLRLAVRSLEMPIEDIQQRLAIFDQKLQEIQRQRLAAGDLLTGERKRLHESLEEECESLRIKATVYLKGVAQETLDAEEGSDEELVRERLAVVIPGYFEHRMGEMTSLFGKRVSEALQSHQRQADALIESVRHVAAELFDIPYQAQAGEGVFEIAQEPYWVTHKWNFNLSLISPGFVDRLLPKGVRRTRITKRLREQIGDLVISNVENLRWAVYRSLDQTFSRFGSNLDERLAAVIAATHGAIAAGLAKRKERSEAVADDMKWLRATEADLSRLKAELS
jgi:GTPase Era involved in 16S rRNA processing